jgi:hypothetical protein
MRCALLLAVLLCTGCTSFQNPIIGETGPALDSALAGRWMAITNEGTVELEVSAAGGEGVAIITSTKTGETPEREELRLITAKLGRLTYGSVKAIDKPESSWTLFVYEVVANRLLIRSDNNRFWNDAVRDHLVSGTIEKKDWTQTVTVTASEQEMRAVILGYGPVIFNDEPLVELQRE